MAQPFIKTADKIATPSTGASTRYVPPRVNAPKEADDHLFRGLTRGGSEGTSSGNPHGIGMGGGEVLDIIKQGKGPMEQDYSAPKVGRSLAGEHSGDPSRN